MNPIELPVNLADELVYRGYAHQRDLAPNIKPSSWEKIFPNAKAFEERYQRERNAHHEALRVTLSRGGI